MKLDLTLCYSGSTMGKREIRSEYLDETARLMIFYHETKFRRLSVVEKF